MEQNTFDAFRKIVYDKSGISIGEKKESLVSSRIGKRMRSLEIESHEEYLEFVTNDDSGDELVQLLDVISTNVTHFFRESQHFDFLTETITQWYNDGQRKFKLWSAGCSSGEEPYTIALTINEALKGKQAETRILATDISTRVLDRAIKGEYEEGKLANVSQYLLSNYFTKSDKGTNYKVKESTKQMILFKRLNLSSMPFPMQGPMDFIFCRNVMIYFDNEFRKKLLTEFFRLLKVGGYLFVGHAESLTGMLSGFKVVKPAVYIK